MSPEAWERLQGAFHAALERPREARPDFAVRAFPAEPDLRSELERLLAHHETGTGASGGEPGGGELPAGHRIGRFEILRKLGEGGMSTVYLAERADAEYRQRVAIKLIKPGACSAEMPSRFRQERQILASLEHPGIARLLDGGSTEEGQPYLVLEHIEGLSITDYCDERHLPVEGRLRLFLELCAAVEHAHRHLVVHRDLKPSNVLVTAAGEPRLLDFGIAKLLSPGLLPEAPALTGTSVRPMTPEYASPEQVRGEAITTASDVYALGVLLYRLLTGRGPYRLEGHGPQELERAICEQEPERPGLEGDLEAIVTKALRKESEHRYPSVERLAEDLERHLRGLPVAARGDAWGYRTRKLLRRHRTGLAAAALVWLATLAGILATSHQAKIARAEREVSDTERARAESLNRFLTGLFEVVDPDRSKGDELTARQILERGVEGLEGGLETEPAAKSSLLATTGEIYTKLGDYERGKELLENALERQLHHLGARHPEVVRSRYQLAKNHFALADYEAAERLLGQAIATGREVLGAEHPQQDESLFLLAVLRAAQGDTEAAERLFRERLAWRRARHGSEHSELADVLAELGKLAQHRGRHAEAEALLREALAIHRRQLGPRHRKVALDQMDLAIALVSQERLEEAEALYREALGMAREILGEDHPYVAHVLATFGELRRKQGAHEEAEALLREALAISREQHGPASLQVALGSNNLARVLHARGEHSAELELLSRAEAIYRQTLGGDHGHVGIVLHNRGKALYAAGRLPEARRTLEEASSILRGALGEGHPRVARTLTWLDRVRAEQGAPAGAEPAANSSSHPSEEI